MFKKEEYAIALDFLPHGKSAEASKEPVVQVIGEAQFTLLEVVPKPGVRVEQGERVYIGKEEREKIEHIKSRIAYAELTSTSQRELEPVVRRIVQEKEKDLVNFLNHSGALNIRSHALEHLPGIGKKHLDVLLHERERKPFEGFVDVSARVPHLGRVEDLFVQRIIQELKGEEKYYLFVKAPRSEEEEGGREGEWRGRRDRRDRRW